MDPVVSEVHCEESQNLSTNYKQHYEQILQQNLEQIYTGWALNRGLFFADPPPSLLGAVSGKISEIR